MKILNALIYEPKIYTDAGKWSIPKIFNINILRKNRKIINTEFDIMSNLITQIKIYVNEYINCKINIGTNFNRYALLDILAGRVRYRISSKKYENT
jgi:hypothetical protein